MNLGFVIHDRGKGILSEAAALQSKKKIYGMRVGGELGSWGQVMKHLNMIGSWIVGSRG